MRKSRVKACIYRAEPENRSDLEQQQAQWELEIIQRRLEEEGLSPEEQRGVVERMIETLKGDGQGG